MLGERQPGQNRCALRPDAGLLAPGPPGSGAGVRRGGPRPFSVTGALPTRGVPALREGRLGAPPGPPAWLPPALPGEAGGQGSSGKSWHDTTREGGRWRRERSCKSHDFPAYINHSLFFSTGCRLKGAVSSFSQGQGCPGVLSAGQRAGWRLHPQWEGQGLGFREPSGPNPSSGLFPSSWRPGHMEMCTY